MSTRVEQVTDVVAYQAEGPVWSLRWGGQRWVDMLAGDVLSLGSDGSIKRRHVGEIAAALRLRGGGAVMGIEQGFALEDPRRRFYCGSMAYDQRQGAASLYRLDPDGTHFARAPRAGRRPACRRAVLRRARRPQPGSTVTGDGRRHPRFGSATVESRPSPTPSPSCCHGHGHHQ